MGHNGSRYAAKMRWIRRYGGRIDDLANHVSTVRSAEAQHLRYEPREAESVAIVTLEQLRLLQGDEAALAQYSLCNVMDATPLFVGAVVAGPPAMRMKAGRGAPSLVYPANSAPASQQSPHAVPT